MSLSGFIRRYPVVAWVIWALLFFILVLLAKPEDIPWW